MNAEDIAHYITTTFPAAESVDTDGNTFFFYASERNFPFATLVTSDHYDQHSNLNRADVFRLNIGVNKETFRSLVGETTNEHDYTALDVIMPHPVYGMMYWLCVLNPSAATFLQVQPLLAEAYEKFAQRKS